MEGNKRFCQGKKRVRQAVPGDDAQSAQSDCRDTVVLSTIRFKALSAGKADLEYTFHELAGSVPNWLTHQIEKGVVEIAD